MSSRRTQLTCSVGNASIEYVQLQTTACTSSLRSTCSEVPACVVEWNCRASRDDLGMRRTEDQRTPNRRRHAVVA
jgi:hypothetical protein